MNEPLGEMFRYNRWANERLLGACAELTEAELDGRVAGTFGSIRRTLVHTIGSQDVFIWRLASGDTVLQARAAAMRGPWWDFAALRTFSERSSEELLVAALNLESDHAVSLPPWEGQVDVVNASFVLLHALYHGIEHRGQVCTTLTQIGLTPPDLDGWGYRGALSPQPAPRL